MAVKIHELLADVPNNLQARYSYPGNVGLKRRRGMVLYFPHDVLRPHDNMGLDLAKHLATKLEGTLVVIFHLSQAAPFYRPRQIAFWEEGARAYARSLAEQGISSYFVLHQPDDKQSYNGFVKLLTGAAISVADNFPSAYWQETLQHFSKISHQNPLIKVDSNSIVPLNCTNKAPVDMEGFRQQTMMERQDWLKKYPLPKPADVDEDWQNPPLKNPIELPYGLEQAWPLPINNQRFFQHSILTYSGGFEAGDSYWQQHKSALLNAYPNYNRLPAHASYGGIGPYLRFGMISPFAIMNDCADEKGGDDSWAFLRYMLVWREMCYHIMHHARGNVVPELLPMWAQDTLSRHKRPNDKGHSLADLTAAMSDSNTWNMLQKGLQHHGYVHEDVLQYWLKKAYALYNLPLNKALPQIQELYSRFALNPDDPVFAGQLLASLGGFTVPDKHVEPVFGQVAAPDDNHPAVKHYAKLKAKESQSLSPNHSPMRVAVIGAGLAGLSAANLIQQYGREVMVYEAGNQPGGRMASQRFGSHSVDYGAPIISGKNPLFHESIRALMKEQRLEEWHMQLFVHNKSDSLRFTSTPFVGKPDIYTVVQDYMDDLSIFLNSAVHNLADVNGGYRLFDKAQNMLGFYDQVVLALPAAQALQLFPLAAPELESLVMHPTFVVMITFAAPLDTKYDAVSFPDGVFTHAYRESSKPGRKVQNGHETWVLHAGQKLSALAEQKEHHKQLAVKLAKTFSQELKLKMPRVVNLSTHWWPYAAVETPLGQPCLVYDNLAICGDWCLGRRVEDAWLSGQHAALQLLNQGKA